MTRIVEAIEQLRAAEPAPVYVLVQRVARQVVAYGLALGHEPPEIIHAVRAELAALGRPEPSAGQTRFEVLPELPMQPLPLAEPGQAVAIHGLVRHDTELDRVDLARLERATLGQPFACEEGWLVPSLCWRGVRLRDVLALAQPLPGARAVRVGAGTYVMLLSSGDAEQAVLADELDGAPLTVEHGAPWRLVVAWRRVLREREVGRSAGVDRTGSLTAS